MRQNKSFNVVTRLLLALLLVLTCIAPSILAVLPQQQVIASADAGSYVSSYTGTYYNSLDESKTGLAFRSELASLLKTTYRSVTTYKGLPNQFVITDKDPNGSGMLLFYTGESASTYNSSKHNREHVWPKCGGVAFPEDTGPGCDIQHLRPCDTQLNSTRSNYGYAEVSKSSNNIAKANAGTNYSNLCYLGSGVDVITGNTISGKFFYPGEGYRGATARILMYMQVMWGDQNDLEFVMGASSTKKVGDFPTLMKWHLEEPPTQAEIYRNQKAYEIQGNRNPFIDHPEYAEMIYCNDGKSYTSKVNQVVAQYGSYLNTPDLVGLTINNNNNTALAKGETKTLTVSANPSNANKDVTWSVSDSSIATISQAGVLTAKSMGSVTVTATSKKNPSIVATTTVRVKEVVGLSISGSVSKTTYDVGDAFDPTGLTVQLQYYDGTNYTYETATNNKCSWLDGTTDSERLALGTTTVKCKYGDVSVVVPNVTISVVSITGIVVTGTPTKTEYYGGQTFDPSGLTVSVTYSNGTSKRIDLSNCQWLDGTTKQSTLSYGTTTVICQKGEQSFVISGITVQKQSISDNLSSFNNAMAQLNNATKQSDKFQAIKSALTCYNNLTQQEKTQIASSYQQLQSKVAEYNSWAEQQNSDAKISVQIVISTFAISFATLLALGYVLKQSM